MFDFNWNGFKFHSNDDFVVVFEGNVFNQNFDLANQLIPFFRQFQGCLIIFLLIVDPISISEWGNATTGFL